jgi:hypothetical protein
MLVKIHSSYRRIVAICDNELLGKKFEEGKRAIEIKESFFKGEEKTSEEILQIIEESRGEDATFYIVGKDSVNIALKSGLVQKEGIIEIQTIPIALVLL